MMIKSYIYISIFLIFIFLSSCNRYSYETYSYKNGKWELKNHKNPPKKSLLFEDQKKDRKRLRRVEKI